MQRPTTVLHAPGRSTAGTEQFFRPGYRAHLVVEWIPAKAFPQSSFHGFDYHDASIERARSLAEAEGVGANTEFSVAGAKELPAEGYDLVCFFDCLHDMGDPVGAMARAREAVAEEAGFSRFRRATETPLQPDLGGAALARTDARRPGRRPTGDESSWTVHDDFADLAS